MPRLALFAILFCAAALLGCQTPAAAPRNAATITGADFERVFDATAPVLRDHGFRVDRQDHRFGTLTTKPRTAPTVFEPWLDQNSNMDQAWNATFNNQRRFVRVTLAPQQDSDTQPQATPLAAPPTLQSPYRLQVEVTIEQQQLPTRHLTGSTDGRHLAPRLASVPRELREQGVTSNYWQPVGRDPLLETRILDDILQRGAGVAAQEFAVTPLADPAAPTEPDATPH